MTVHNPFGRRHRRGGDHLQSCAECAAAVHRERQYIERLRGAAVPPASDDLTARLLARTQVLATAPPHPAPPQHLAAKVLVLAAGGTAAAAGVLAVSAFALAGDDLPVAGNALAGSLVQQSEHLPADGRELSEAQLTQLRSDGWVCPELESLGFHVQSATVTTVDGRPAVEMHLSDGKYYATVLEQHREDRRRPVDGQPGVGELQIRGSSPWTATYETPAATFTYESDRPEEQADDAVPVLQELSTRASAGVNAGIAAEPAAAEADARDDSLSGRLQRGIRKITEMLTP
ncbi:anti-sigma factor RsiW [Arthrobacter pascens]|uniref:anti-sigma factor n=1 Tax=Arthrobacter pascens TaxID=1677 RepID=UPI002791B780|nr:anti-sigma factor [Arthrobacter pascens]MDQ0677669.1 anti-sigma factor RsiW [Arthrobacter pascens]